MKDLNREALDELYAPSRRDIRVPNRRKKGFLKRVRTAPKDARSAKETGIIADQISLSRGEIGTLDHSIGNGNTK